MHWTKVDWIPQIVQQVSMLPNHEDACTKIQEKLKKKTAKRTPLHIVHQHTELQASMMIYRWYAAIGWFYIYASHAPFVFQTQCHEKVYSIYSDELKYNKLNGRHFGFYYVKFTVYKSCMYIILTKFVYKRHGPNYIFE